MPTSDLGQQCQEKDVLPFQAFQVDRPPQQKILAALVHKTKAKNISQESTRMRLQEEYESTGGENLVALQVM